MRGRSSRKGLRPCACCGSATYNARFCSNQCQRDLEWRLIKSQIDESGVVPAGRSGHSRFARRYVLLAQGHRCAVCKLTEWCGKPIPLVLDHINGDAADWRVSNLRLVCGNCDMQLPTFKARNRGKGRAWRRERYAKGLSY